MELNDNDPHHQPHTFNLTAYFPQPTTAAVAAASPPSPTNVLPPDTTDTPSGSHHTSHSVGPSVTLELAKRRRGRPRKYETPEQALAAKKSAAACSRTDRSAGEERSFSSTALTSYLPNSQQLSCFGTVGQGFTQHVIHVSAGEDVCQRIMMFLEQMNSKLCILSASGTISNAFLHQAATSGGTIAYEGRYEILSLSGSYVYIVNGVRTGRLSVCLSSSDGQIIGGGVAGPLKAAGPVQVIVGSFEFDNKKVKGDASASKLPSPVGAAAVPNLNLRSPVESSMRNDDHPNIGGSYFMPQARGMQMTPLRSTDWRTSPDVPASPGFDLIGKFGYKWEREEGEGGM